MAYPQEISGQAYRSNGPPAKLAASLREKCPFTAH